MSGRLAGKVAVITGAARGQGRSHALRLAEEGADIIALDICEQIETVRYPLGTEEELASERRGTASRPEAAVQRSVPVGCTSPPAGSTAAGSPARDPTTR